ncbi:TadE/TadG family type IV pilus assembly protein [Streptomyces koyangensis]|uniref:TadE/TadG family type IV pilus assembly protein n=1 Tax=Streptomyces koyangensis TaxID=188770 RepID=UPI003669EE90
MRAPDRRRVADRGAVAIEAAIVLPVLLALGLLFLAGGRVALAAQKTDAAAEAGARAASLARTPGAAQAEARRAAAAALAQRSQSCTAYSVEADTGGLTVPVGQVSEVTVTVECTVAIGDLLLLGGGPGVRTVSGSFTSVVDAYRER